LKKPSMARPVPLAGTTYRVLLSDIESLPKLPAAPASRAVLSVQINVHSI
jgi:hypothetical protein